MKQKAQQGISLISAIFILVLFAALAGLMVSLVSTGNITAAQDALGSKAEHGAQAGVEWGMFQLDPNGDSAVLPACFSAATLPTLSEFPGMTINVSCSAFPSATGQYTEGGQRIRIYRITATASNGASPPTGVERVVEVTLEKCRDGEITTAPYDC